MSPTSRTLKWLRDSGFAADVAERWVAQAGVRRDLFHCIDIVAIKAGEPILGVQSTVAGCVSARLAKARGIPELRTWLAAGGRFIVIGWAKVSGRWSPRTEELLPNSLGALETVNRARPPRRLRKSRHASADLFEGIAD